MHFSIIAPVILAAAPLAVSAKGTLDYEADFDALSNVTKIVRTYNTGGSCDTGAQIMPAAVSKGFKVVLGVWPDTEESYQSDKAALKAVMADSSLASAVYAITVGSEALYRTSVNQTGMTPEALLAKIQDMQNTFPTAKIGTVDSWSIFHDGTADLILKSGINLVMANGFSYWQGQTIGNASHSYLDDLFQAYTHIQDVSSQIDIEIWNGETGWPGDGGSNYENTAIAGTKNAETFFKGGVCAALNWGFNVFYFEAFDEPNKPNAVGEDGTVQVESKWGAFTSDRTPKFSLACS